MNAHDNSAPQAIRRGWMLAVAIVLSLLAIRIVYLVYFSTWELVGDEAHYWEWSRRLALSYYTKGPGIAWVIWIGTHFFGDNAAAVRIPSAVGSAIMLLFGARLAFDVAGRDGRAAWCTALTLGLVPGYLATAQLATTDCFYSAAWTAAAYFLWHAIRPDASTVRRLLSWTLAGSAVGIGCLFKYTALLELLGIIAFLFVQRRRLIFDRTFIAGPTLAILALLAATSPMILWNARNGWPTIAHQIGRLRLPGGDESVSLAWSPLWFPTFAGAQVALLGVVGAILIVLSIRHSRSVADPTQLLARSLLLWLALPILTFYLGLSLFREAQGNWAIAGYSTLLILVGTDAAHTLGSRPRAAFQSLWHWQLGIGVVAAIVLFIGPAITHAPGLRNLHAMRRLEERVSGARTRATLVHALATAIEQQTGRRPMIVTKGYQDASLLAFYLPGHPTVRCAGSAFGSRPNAYDYFADTRLDDPARVGQDAILIGANADRWRSVLRFDAIEPSQHGSVFIARDYRGLVREHEEARR